MSKEIKRIAVTGGAGQIAYSLLFRIAQGDLLGRDQPIALHLLDLSSFLGVLKGVKMELEDCNFPLLKEIIIGDNPYEIFEGIHYALLVGASPRGPGMERKDLLYTNAKIFMEQGKALQSVADPNVKVWVIGNPCNTNCLIAMSHAPRIPKKNFYALTRLDQNRATFQLAAKAGCAVGEVSNVAIWGNHSTTQVPDPFHAEIRGKPAVSVIQDQKWLEEDFISIVQKRGAAVIEARGKSSAASASQAIIQAVQDMLNPTPSGRFFSAAVYSHGNPYGVADHLVFSFPCRSQGEGRYEIVSDLELNPFLRSKLKLTEQELIEERELVKNLINEGYYGRGSF